MIIYQQTTTDYELEEILKLQQENLPGAVSQEETNREGFVTVRHNFSDLKGLAQIEPHLVAKEDDNVVGYLLAMTKESQYSIPVLVPMFQLFEQLTFAGQRIADYEYMVVGQVCVQKAYRGQGIFDNLYKKYQQAFAARYHFAITEIAALNGRSLQAHKRVGFTEIHRYTAPDKLEWIIVLWDWRHTS